MVTRRTTKMPRWAEEFLAEYRPPTKADLKKRQRVLKEALRLREQLDICPMTTEELIRSVRDER